MSFLLKKCENRLQRIAKDLFFSQQNISVFAISILEILNHLVNFEQLAPSVYLIKVGSNSNEGVFINHIVSFNNKKKKTVFEMPR